MPPALLAGRAVALTVIGLPLTVTKLAALAAATVAIVAGGVAAAGLSDPMFASPHPSVETRLLAGNDGVASRQVGGEGGGEILRVAGRPLVSDARYLLVFRFGN